ncbi:MAG: oligosaccharide flippase family protein [Paludibacter sp.]|jgi:O-antigen/teichoic acid export membrane protein|nr:oligosaccharide flippase family protein [Paludibacter sp.]
MDNPRENTKRIAKNTVFLYLRTLFTVIIGLYTSRVILNVLGVSDYGTYTLVGGFVAVFSTVAGVFPAAIQRFLTYELGKNNQERLKRVFSTSINIQVALALVMFVVAEIAGVWWLNNKINIPAERMTAAYWVFQFSLLNYMLGLMNMPYIAVITAHEHFKTFALVGLLDAVFKLCAVLLLMVLPADKLVAYSVLVLCFSFIIRIIYNVYCRKHFTETKYKYVYDKGLLKEMLSLVGWNFFGSTAQAASRHGVTIVLNLFFGTVVNAAQGIAVQVNGTISTFIYNFMTALNPQITKSYASGEHQYMFSLVQQGARFSFYLLLFLSLPVLLETEYILTIWLKITPPAHSVNFVRLMLIGSLLGSLANTFYTVMMATGKIKKYQIWVSSLQMLILPVVYVALKFGSTPEMAMLISIIIGHLSFFVQLFLLSRSVGLSVGFFLKKVYVNVLIVAFLSAVLPLLVYLNMEQGIVRLLCVCVVSVLSSGTFILFAGCKKEERKFLMNKVNVLIKKVIASEK